MNMKEKTAYIKGLMEGIEIDCSKPEGKLIKALAEVVDSMASEIETIKENVDICNDYIEEIDEDLGAVEDIVYEDISDCGCDCDDDDEDCDCCDGDFYCAMCPSCGEKIYFDESCDPSEVVCPSCQSPLISEDDDAEKTEE